MTTPTTPTATLPLASGRITITDRHATHLEGELVGDNGETYRFVAKNRNARDGFLAIFTDQAGGKLTGEADASYLSCTWATIVHQAARSAGLVA